MSAHAWIDVSLALIGLGFTALGVVVALVALWGYKKIKEDAAELAKTAALAAVNEYLGSENIRDKLKIEVAERVAKEADILFADLSLSAAYPQQTGDSGETKAVAGAYPEKEGSNGPDSAESK